MTNDILKHALKILKANDEPIYPIFGLDENGLFVIDGKDKPKRYEFESKKQ